MSKEPLAGKKCWNVLTPIMMASSMTTKELRCVNSWSNAVRKGNKDKVQAETGLVVAA